MKDLSDELIARITRRALDPKRRYMTAAQDEGAVSLPTGDIASKFAASSPEAGEVFRQMQERMASMGFDMPTMSFVEGAGHISASSNPPGAKPLAPPPGERDWAALEAIAGAPMPADLKQLYTIADGGFGPGFTGLHSVESIGSNCEDLRRRGPDYCGTIHYPASFLPIADETLNYHYDLDTGRIISSNQDWENDGLDPEDVYDVAHQSLAAMMEHWLAS